MRRGKHLSLLMISVWALANVALAQFQTADQTQSKSETPTTEAPATTVDQAIDRIIAREQDEIATIRRYNPIIETYIQEMKPNRDMGAVPIRDHYFLGQANLSKGVVDNSMLASKKGTIDRLNPISHLSGYFTSSYVPDGFLQMVYIDMNGLDREHYQFEYVGREFLGDVRCAVFDVTPLPKSGRGRFKGRFWAEDQSYTIVRFNGIYTPVVGDNGVYLHFDSWRMNLAPGLWLPAFVFSQESDLKDSLGNHVRFKSQTRLWGYDLTTTNRQQEFSELTIEAPNVVQDKTSE
jgi:hypothetical protein